MEKPERKRLKSQKDDTHQILNIFPDLVWRLILDKLNNATDYYKVCKSFPASHDLFSGCRTKVLFGDVIKVILQRLENRQEPDIRLADIVSLRQICKTWKLGVDYNLQNLSSNYIFCSERKIPRSQFEKDLDKKYGYRFKSADDYEDFQRHFESSHEATGVNPFITRSIKISILTSMLMEVPEIDLLTSTCLDMCQKFGKHVWYLHFEAAQTSLTCVVHPYHFITLLKRILYHFPNLRVLKFEPPIHLRVQYEILQFSEDTNLQIPSVRTDGRYAARPHHPNSRQDPTVIMTQLPAAEPERHDLVPPTQGHGSGIQIVNRHGQLVNPLNFQMGAIAQAQLGPVLPMPGNPGFTLQPIGSGLFMMRRVEPTDNLGQNNPINIDDEFGIPPDTPEVPVLPHLRFVDQGEMSFKLLMEIVRPNMQSLHQVGVTIASAKEYQDFFELPLKLTKLEINLSELDMPWYEIFPMLENRYGQTLETLHIHLPHTVVACQPKLPKLKVLHLLLNNAVPLDSLLRMANNLEELHVKIGQMNQEEYTNVQRGEDRVVFYRHLAQLANSNIWTEFPKLRKVRVGSLIEIDNMTPFWECTVEDWKHLNQ